MIEILITLAIVGVAGFILFKNVRSSAKGECHCSSSSSCSSSSCAGCSSSTTPLTIKK
ncbi:FeoB-associated Cys-rich membrane protein [Clostridium manihotivorum]|uniref:FeoB-associated Cys-rich membrane protein n=1 Tax=Clostridium manihotivorum TaxID=2320868 RepID=A0A3R5UHJ6_9CLOT|nr:FeoB-associated Cys-rich membrane protein [Clostridium manihotivorum]QAA33865.1 FeoB-associated Cys-rich membrane protein [Clostridium manihotivorum]